MYECDVCGNWYSKEYMALLGKEHLCASCNKHLTLIILEKYPAEYELAKTQLKEEIDEIY